MSKLIKLKDCYIDSIDYECNIYGGCPTCHCGGETIADLTFYLENHDYDYVSITNSEDNCLAISHNVFKESDCMKILGSRNDFSLMTLHEFIEWFCNELQNYIKVGEIQVEFCD